MRSRCSRCRDLHVAYGKAEVVHGVRFDVREGEFVVMLGRNGAGKSTMLHAISGLIGKRAGRVSLRGPDISAREPRDIVQAGIVQVLEGHRVFTPLSVEDNLLIGTYAAQVRAATASKLQRVYDAVPRAGRAAPAARLAPERRAAADPRGRAGHHRRSAAC